MRKNTYLHDNNDVNLILKGFTSVLIGIYMIIGVYLIQTILTGFLIDDNPLGMLSAEIIELFCIGILFLVFLGTSVALIFGGRRIAKKFQYRLWNSKTTTSSHALFYTHDTHERWHDKCLDSYFFNPIRSFSFSLKK